MLLLECDAVIFSHVNPQLRERRARWQLPHVLCWQTIPCCTSSCRLHPRCHDAGDFRWGSARAVIYLGIASCCCGVVFNQWVVLLGNVCAACGPGVPFDVIGHIIASGAKKEGFGVSWANLAAGMRRWFVVFDQVVERFTGHGIGTDMHMYPHVFHIPTGNRLTMRSGITFTIEPMVTAGKYRTTHAWIFHYIAPIFAPAQVHPTARFGTTAGALLQKMDRAFHTATKFVLCPFFALLDDLTPPPYQSLCPVWAYCCNNRWRGQNHHNISRRHHSTGSSALIFSILMAATRLAYDCLLHVQKFYYFKTTTTAFLGFYLAILENSWFFLLIIKKGNVWRFSNKIDSLLCWRTKY